MKTSTNKKNYKTIDEIVDEKLRVANEILSKADLSFVYETQRKK